MANCCVKVHACHKMPLIMLAINFYCLDADANVDADLDLHPRPEPKASSPLPQKKTCCCCWPGQFMTYMRHGHRHLHRQPQSGAHLEAYRALLSQRTNLFCVCIRYLRTGIFNWLSHLRLLSLSTIYFSSLGYLLVVHATH